MKKLVLFVTILFALMAAPANKVYATDESVVDISSIAESIDRQIYDSTDSDTSEIISGYGLDVGSSEGFDKLTFSEIVKALADSFIKSLKAPMKMLGKLMAAVLLCALMLSLDNGDGALSEALNTAGTLAVIIAVYGQMSAAIEAITASLDTLSGFMLSYIPVFSSVTAAVGNFSAGTGYYGTDLFLCECMAFVSRTVLMPMISILTALSVTGAVNTDIKFGRAALIIKKGIQWLFGIMMILFTGLLTVQGTVGAASDSLKSRAVRLSASSFIPFVGGAISESYSALKGSLGVIKAGTGSIGIIIIAVITVPPLIAVIANRAALSLAKLFCEMMGLDSIASFLDELGTILAIAMSVLIFFSLMFVISTGVVLITTLNIGS